MIQSIDPSTEKILKTFPEMSQTAVEKMVTLADSCQRKWRNTSFSERGASLHKVADILRTTKEELALIATKEMGKTITSALFEVEKCAGICDYFADNAERLLSPEQIATEAQRSYVSFDPLGVVLAIMPWNYPFSQVFRCAVPAIMAGNTTLLKHASAVPQSALAIHNVFIKAGVLEGVFQTMLISSQTALTLIGDSRIKAVTFTGSEAAGKEIASTASLYIKKSVLELGGSDPFIGLDDADIEKAVAVGVASRLLVSGQTCISAKRFILSKNIAQKFINHFKDAMREKIIGDPTNNRTEVGPLSSEQCIKNIERQVSASVKMGAQIVLGGERLKGPGYFYPPTILINVTEKMPVFEEETFGPVAAVIVASTDEEALHIANNTRFGLGATVYTTNKKRADYFIKNLEVGNVYINSMVKSDSRLPFGGVKASGFGRELSSYGIKEFTNIKSAWIDGLN